MPRNNNEFKKQKQKNFNISIIPYSAFKIFFLFICQETQKQAFEVLLAIQVAELAHCPQHKPDMYRVTKK